MCGIVGAVAKDNVVPFLMGGLHRLEYRGYDSAGLVVLQDGVLKRARAVGKVEKLQALVEQTEPQGFIGIAHTRWATHGAPNEVNAHPHVVGERVAIVHNGIIENYAEIRTKLIAEGMHFVTQTDTEVIANLVLLELNKGNNLLSAVQFATQQLQGAYAIAVMDVNEPNRVIVVRMGSPLLIGIGNDANYIASDISALLPVTKRFVVMEQGDIADIYNENVDIYDINGESVERTTLVSNLNVDSVNRGKFRHYMLKEIHEQPDAVVQALEGRLGADKILDGAFGPNAKKIFKKVKSIRILACGTSYIAGMVARNWFEGLAKIPCQVEVASEFKSRHPVAEKDSLVVVLSQSGETADTLAALAASKEQGFGPSLGIVNVPQSSMVREVDIPLLMHAGPEIGVASTKAFTTQLVCLLMLVCALGRRKGMDAELEKQIVGELRALPALLTEYLQLDEAIEQWAAQFADKQHALYLGRGVQYPIAMEGALKLKEISYIHAEAYPAGELKHGPLALVDQNMPVVVVAPRDGLLSKVKANMAEVRARGGQIFVFSDAHEDFESDTGLRVMSVPDGLSHITPIVFTVPLQLLAYHIAVIKGTDVDRPRNLAKSVTVE